MKHLFAFAELMAGDGDSDWHEAVDPMNFGYQPGSARGGAIGYTLRFEFFYGLAIGFHTLRKPRPWKSFTFTVANSVTP